VDAFALRAPAPLLVTLGITRKHSEE